MHPFEITAEQRELLELLAQGEELHAYLSRIVLLIEQVTVGRAKVASPNKKRCYYADLQRHWRHGSRHH